MLFYTNIQVVLSIKLMKIEMLTETLRIREMDPRVAFRAPVDRSTQIGSGHAFGPQTMSTSDLLKIL